MRHLFLLSGLLLMLSSCKEDINYNPAQFEGHWEVVKAKRDGKVTNTLSGAWVKLKGTDMKDNFFTGEVSYPFSLNGAELIHHAEPKRIYKVMRIATDTMELSTKHLDYKFEFTFEKKNS